MYVLRAKRDDGRQVTLTVGENDGLWFAVVVESALDASPEQALDDHGHHVLGTEFASETQAKRAAETYARRWRAGKVLAPPSCACPDIEERH